MRVRSVHTFGLLCMAAFAMIAGTRAHAASIETLLMPGKVVRDHAKWESECSSCHDRAHPQRQTGLCLDCHKGIAADLRDHHGYHGRMPGAATAQCRACHTEHKGRDADIVQLHRAQFDHRLTDFPLENAHAHLACEACHKPGQSWRKAPTRCADCHKADDPHHGQFKQDCGECHSTSSWSGARFDHDKTHFKLTGAHTALACDACHVGGHYADTPQTCFGCHATDDEHRGSRGQDCGRCHVTSKWKTAKFDHLKETRFALLGVHDQIDCLACHRSGNYKDKIPKDCEGCHQADDAHAGRFGPKCDDCHGNDHWQVEHYDHAGLDHYALRGAHAKLDCMACHTGPVKTQKLPKDCAGCHKSQDPHGGRLKGGCDACHGENHWRSDIVFDHDLTSYPLLGLHRVVACAECHTSMAFHSTPKRCDDCHARDDAHHGGLGKKCESCHSPNGWRVWTFDHDKQTHFPLLGAHRKLECSACHHQDPGTVKTPTICVACHEKDDRHLGQYGGQCDRCHTVDSWKGARIQ
ncbi:MAG: cytochrome C [Gammaproteobacteria bacterium]|nr:cytochrome C [Gammaproteobacteria bacterium]